jgi:ParB family chromosome partitioning protein
MKRNVLGKGIEAIISNKPYPEKESNFFEVDIEDIYPNPDQPRKKFSAEKIKELAASIQETGLIQPVVVNKREGKYYLIVGERRWRAAQYLRWKKIPVIIKDISPNEVVIDALIENIQREDLNAIEIAEGIELMMKKTGLNQEQTAEKLGMNRTTVTNYLRLLKLPEAIQQGIISADVSQGHARSLLGLNDTADMLDVYSKIIKGKLSVRQAENLVKNFYIEPSKVEKKVDPDIQKAEEKLTRFFATKVKLNYSSTGKGKVEIFFNNLDDFDRICKLFLKE